MNDELWFVVVTFTLGRLICGLASMPRCAAVKGRTVFAWWNWPNPSWVLPEALRAGLVLEQIVASSAIVAHGLLG